MLRRAPSRSLDSARSATNTWWNRTFPDLAPQSIAYFSAEFALHQSLPIYAGGLGVLAGDHCKEASDLGVPLVGIGFMYPQGYFHQQLSADGWQEESYEKLNWAGRADRAGDDADRHTGASCRCRSAIGRCSPRCGACSSAARSCYLLDTDLEENAPWDRQLSARLYGGDRETRVQQEIILGIGGVRALRALGPVPGGLAPERRPRRRSSCCSASASSSTRGARSTTALEEVRRTTVFTTHTPVPAGHDAFPFHLVETAPGRRLGHARRAPRRDSSRSAHYDNGGGSQFNMTALALRSSGVGQRRQPAARRGHRDDVGADLAGRRAPIACRSPRSPTACTRRRGCPPTCRSCSRSTSGTDWVERHDDPAFWDAVMDIPDEELWAVRVALRNHLFAFIRERARRLLVRGARQRRPRAGGRPAARRPRPDDRLRAPLHRLQAARADLPRPRAARADPAQRRAARCRSSSRARRTRPTSGGKHILQSVYRKALDPAFGGRIAFVDDYDLHVAHFLVQGCDVWLNNPRKPLEASGTSGMKACMNGVPQLSIGDGWWAEGYTGRNGWLIEGHAPADDEDATDAGRRRSALPPARAARSCRPSTTATSRASRGGGCAWSRRRSARWRRLLAPAGW